MVIFFLLFKFWKQNFENISGLDLLLQSNRFLTSDQDLNLHYGPNGPYSNVSLPHIGLIEVQDLLVSLILGRTSGHKQTPFTLQWPRPKAYSVAEMVHGLNIVYFFPDGDLCWSWIKSQVPKIYTPLPASKLIHIFFNYKRINHLPYPFYISWLTSFNMKEGYKE
jgi:hypothetical protein